MNVQDTDTGRRSVYSLGASDGAWVGLAMGICMLCMIESGRFPVLSYVALALLVAVPIIVWKMLRRSWISGQTPHSFSAVWLHGICIFLFGALIMALIMYVTLRFLSPGWIENQVSMAALQLAADPATVPQARMLNSIIESGQLPSAIYTSVTAIWLVSFTGSLWSMLFAFFLTRTARYRRLRQN